MSDPSRPSAPFLPPEIVHQIIENITPKDKSYHLIARISSSWSTEAQARIFSDLNQLDESKLRTLIPILESNELLASFVTSAEILRSYKLEEEDQWSFDGSDEGEIVELEIEESSDAGSEEEDEEEEQEEEQAEDDHITLVFQLLSKVSNLKKLKFHAHYYDFTAEQRSSFFSKLLLPSLVDLELITSHKDLSKANFECILVTAPNIETFNLRVPYKFEDDHRWMSEEQYKRLSDPPSGPPSRWAAYPKKLKSLLLTNPKPFVEGVVFPLRAYKGLESFEMYVDWGGRSDKHHRFDQRPAFGDGRKFFKAVGPTLKTLELGLMTSVEVENSLKYLVALEIMRGIFISVRPGIGSLSFFENLPSTLKRISIPSGNKRLLEAFKNYHESPKNRNHLSLDYLEIDYCDETINLAHVIETKTLYLAFPQTFSILPPLKLLEIKDKKFQKLVVGMCRDENRDWIGDDEDSIEGRQTMKDIRKRCEELGIERPAQKRIIRTFDGTNWIEREEVMD